jgi:hypothetical protein
MSIIYDSFGIFRRTDKYRDILSVINEIIINLKKKITFIFTSFVFIFSINVNAQTHSLNIEKQNIEKIISEIPEVDLSRIKNLFECLFKSNELSFTLYGDKPVSFCNTIIINPNSLLVNDLSIYLNFTFQGDKIYQNEWLAWQRYRHLFKIKNYTFVEGKLGVFLINKNALRKCVSDNKVIFSKILGKDFDVETLIIEMEKGNDVFKLLGNNHELLGIILGFGNHNSKLFQRKAFISRLIELHRIPLNPRNAEFLPKEYASLEEELNYLQENFEPFNKADQFLCLINFNRVMFAVDPHHKETKMLRKKYEANRQNIIEKNSRDDWFQQILGQLTSD